jgi:hypothetical protein
MSSTELIDEINEYINYTGVLENAYLVKHQEIEFIYEKLGKIMRQYYTPESNNIPQERIIKLINDINNLIDKDGKTQKEQKNILEQSKKNSRNMQERMQKYINNSRSQITRERKRSKKKSKKY